jgi:putative transposase
MALPFDTSRGASAWHLVQRARERCLCFRQEADFQTYAYWLQKYSGRYEVDIHAWVLMPDHLHLLATSVDPWACPEMLQTVARQYQHHYQERYGSWAAVWDEEVSANPVVDDLKLLRCYRYIEMHPVRSELVTDPSAYRWSSYTCNALGMSDGLCCPHSAYLELASDRIARRLAYQALFVKPLARVAMAEIRQCLSEGTRL